MCQRMRWSMCLRQAKLGKGGRDVTITPRKPFVGTLRVEARPVASDQRLEASLASGRGNLPGEAQTASPKAMLLSVERPFVGASAFHIPGATLLHWSGLVTAGLPASTEHGKRTPGVPQELGRSCRLLRDIPAGDTGLPTPGPGGALVRRGAKRTSERWRYCQTKATKCGGTGGRMS